MCGDFSMTPTEHVESGRIGKPVSDDKSDTPNLSAQISKEKDSPLFNLGLRPTATGVIAALHPTSAALAAVRSN
jgi:hypothetical protein